MVGSSLIWLVIGAIPFLLPLLFQTVFGWSPIKSGALVLFVFVGNIAIKPATSFLYRTYGFRRVLLAAVDLPRPDRDRLRAANREHPLGRDRDPDRDQRRRPFGLDDRIHHAGTERRAARLRCAPRMP